VRRPYTHPHVLRALYAALIPAAVGVFGFWAGVLVPSLPLLSVTFVVLALSMALLHLVRFG